MRAIKAPQSKSEAHRFLICECLSRLSLYAENAEKSFDEAQAINLKEVTAPNSQVYIDSDDVKATSECLNKIEFAVLAKRQSQSAGSACEELLLDCKESGSSLRFLLPITAALGLKVKFIMGGRLPDRPIESLINQLCVHGCKIERNKNYIKCEGRLAPGDFYLPGDESSQFISGLMFALPLLDEESRIIVGKPIESSGYIKMTMEMLHNFSIIVESIDKGDNYIYKIASKQKFKAPNSCNIGGDWSNAAFWFAAGALGNEPVSISGLNLNSVQADRYIRDILCDMGVIIKISDCNGMPVCEIYPIRKNRLKAVKVDAANIPDLVPVLSLLCCFADGESEIYNVQRLRGKESDRILAIEDLINSIGGKVEVKGNSIFVNGIDFLHGANVRCYADHRMVMTAAIASIRCKSKVIISEAEAVNKSYANFFGDLAKLGLDGNIEYR